MNKLIRNVWSKICVLSRKVANGFRRAHPWVKIIEPWGIILVPVAFVATLIQLNIALFQLDTDRKIREATLIGLASDRLEAAREMDESQDKIARNNVGQVRMLEIMAESGISFRKMNLSYVYLRHIELAEADLRDVDFTCAKLNRANLAGSDLSGACLRLSNLSRAKLEDVNFSKADLSWANLNWNNDISEKTDFSEAIFGDTRLSNLDLSKARGLTDNQIRAACGRKVILPAHITVKLEECTKEQTAAQKCEKRRTENQKTRRILRRILSELRRASK